MRDRFGSERVSWIVVIAILVVGAIAGMSASRAAVDVTITVTPAQAKLIQWALAQPPVSLPRPGDPPPPTTVREYLERLVDRQLARVMRERDEVAKVDFGNVLKTADATKCQAIATAMVVPVASLPCGGGQ